MKSCIFSEKQVERGSWQQTCLNGDIPPTMTDKAKCNKVSFFSSMGLERPMPSLQKSYVEENVHSHSDDVVYKLLPVPVHHSLFIEFILIKYQWNNLSITSRNCLASDKAGNLLQTSFNYFLWQKYHNLKKAAAGGLIYVVLSLIGLGEQKQGGNLTCPSIDKCCVIGLSRSSPRSTSPFSLEPFITFCEIVASLNFP